MIKQPKKYFSVKCIKPWTTLFIKDNQLKVCCWSKQILAKLKTDSSLAHFWNNDIAQYVRQRMLAEETEDICPKTCPILNLKSDDCTHFEKHRMGFSENEQRIYEHIRNGDSIIDSQPYDIGVIIDHVCNLKCRMCFIFDNPNYVVSSGFYKIIEETHNSLKYVYLIGGEPFFSPRSLRFINDCINKNFKFKFGFVTNCTILDRGLLAKIRIDGFCVSIDAATKQTYEKIRRGASWEQVLRNLRSLIQFSKEHQDRFVIKVAFVVMTSNFREIPQAIELFEAMGVALEFPPIIQILGHPENIFEKEEYYDELMKIVAAARRKTSQDMVLNSLKILEEIVVEQIACDMRRQGSPAGRLYPRNLETACKDG